MDVIATISTVHVNSTYNEASGKAYIILRMGGLCIILGGSLLGIGREKKRRLRSCTDLSSYTPLLLSRLMFYGDLICPEKSK